jgi:hypothetical protein
MTSNWPIVILGSLASLLATTLYLGNTARIICNNIPSPPAYGVYISLLLRYPSGCGSCQYFLNRGLLLTRTLMNQGLLLVNLKSSLRKLYDRHHILSWPLRNICVTSDHGNVPLVVHTSRSFPHSSHITGFVTRALRRVPLVEQELLALPRHMAHPGFSGSRVSPSEVFGVVFCRSKYMVAIVQLSKWWLQIDQ